MNVEEMLHRAGEMLGKGTVYRAGAGGLDPLDALCGPRVSLAQVWADLEPRQQRRLAPLAARAHLDVHSRIADRPACDCSGYVCWALGISRKRDMPATWSSEEGWINTDSIWADATGPQGAFVLLRPGDVRRGAMLVHPRPRGSQYGHIGIVTHVGPDGHATRVLHCSAGNFERSADAIAETDTAAFDDPRLGAVAAWYRFLQA